MQRMNRMVRVLVAVFVLGSSLVLLSCSSDDEDENVVDVDTLEEARANLGGRTFTFTGSTVFGVASATLAFSNDATQFQLTSGTDRRARGTVVYRSCDFTVVTSNYASGAGPQVGQTFTADPCEFNSDTSTLTVSFNNVTATSTATQPNASGSFTSSN